MAKWYNIQNNTEASGEASVFVNGDIGFFGVNAAEFIAEVKALNVQKLNVRINSGGGEVFEALSIANFLKNSKVEVEIFIESLAGSAATLIALAGSPVNIAPNAFFFIHNPSAMAGGESDDLRSVADDMDKIRDSILTTYQAKTGLSTALLQSMMDDETLLTAQEALGLGFVDNILSESSGKIAAHMNKWGSNGNDLQTKIKNKMDNTELKTEVSSMKETLTNLVNKLTGKDAEATKEVKISDQAEFVNKLAEIENNVATATADNEALKAKNEALTTELETATAELEALKEGEARSETEATSTEENENKELTDEVTVINTLGDSLAAKIKNKYAK